MNVLGRDSLILVESMGAIVKSRLHLSADLIY